MDDVHLGNPSSSNPLPSNGVSQPPIDLVGGPFAVIESDPGVFTSLTRRVGIRGVELVEMYDIEPWAVDHLSPRGLIFCFMWRRDSHRPADFNDPAAERVWFANQLSDDACATHAILNVVLNCPDIDVGDELRMFKDETEKMSPVMRGLAITNCPNLRQAHNSLARPADIRGALNALTTTSLSAQRAKLKALQSTDPLQPPAAKRARVTKSSKAKGKEKAKDTKVEEEQDGEETYHFIGYVPAFGKVWELDGLKSGPLEVGELPISRQPEPSSSSSSTQGWMDVVRPALRMKMEKYGGSGSDGSNIRFSLLAIVDDVYEGASDELEFLKREKNALERRMDESCKDWRGTVDGTLLEAGQNVFECRHRNLPSTKLGKVFAKDFGSRKMTRDMEIMKMPVQDLTSAWETCVREALNAKLGVEDELAKGVRANTDHVKRTFDYEPFFTEFIRHLHEEGTLDLLLDKRK